MDNKNSSNDINVTIDGIQVSVPKGTSILEAARKANIHIPTLCDQTDLPRRAVCRLCVVECDGNSKLSAACANAVWEGLTVVTHSERILSVRKMIIELLLANHPQECLGCIRSKNCRLQSLAEQVGIRGLLFRPDARRRQPPITESNTLVRDMDKCVACGSCLAACQNIQAVYAISSSNRSFHYGICTPYNTALGDGPCIFCGQCVEVCPVAALTVFDQSSRVWEALDSNKKTFIQIPQSNTLDGRLITALKRMGFYRVYNADFFAELAEREMDIELAERLKNNIKFPNQTKMIKTSTPLWVEKFYPDLADYLPAGRSIQEIFAKVIKTQLKTPESIAVTVTPSLYEKYAVHYPGIALTPEELIGMINLAGLDLTTLPETPFDSIDTGTYDNFAINPDPQILEAKKNIISIKGLANAHPVMESIRKGECKAVIVEINS